MNPKAKKAIDIITYVIIGIIFVFAVIAMISSLSTKKNDGIPSMFGSITLSVKSDSMKGEFNKGDLIFVKKYVKNQLIKEGDIITFWSYEINPGQKELNTHKVVKVIQNQGTNGVYYTFETRGVNNPSDDKNRTSQDEIVGIYTGSKMPGLGAVITFMQSSLGFGLVVVLPLFLFFGYQIFNVIRIVVAMKKEKEGGITQDDQVLKELEELRAKVAAMENKSDAKKEG